jgi:Domain of unknown function (DUF1961)
MKYAFAILALVSGLCLSSCAVAGGKADVPTGLGLEKYDVVRVYAADFSNPLKVVAETDLFKGGKRVAVPKDADWVLEGKTAKAYTRDGRLHLSNGNDDGKGYHTVLWNTRTFPENFLLEFGFSPQHSDKGLAIVFFCAKARSGGSIFKEGVPLRGGNFKTYHSGALDSYHVSYWATYPDGRGRKTANLRKNYGFAHVATGKDLIYGKGAGPHRVRILKIGGEVTLEVNGKVALRFVDDGKKHGTIHGAGSIGLRQMQYTDSGTYTHFKVWDVKTK